MGLWLTTFLVAVASALIPVVNIELYLGGLGALARGNALWFGLAAGLGQTVGKVIWHQGTMRAMDTERVQKKLAEEKFQQRYQRWTERMGDRPWYAAAVVFVSSFTGFPPLLLLAMVAGALRMPLVVFTPTVLVGRTLRFWLLLQGVDLVLH